MNDQAQPPRNMNDLPPETKQFLAQLRDDDIETLKDGLRLVTAVRTVGSFVKWTLVSIVGIIVGFVMLWESILKLLGFMHK